MPPHRCATDSGVGGTTVVRAGTAVGVLIIRLVSWADAVAAAAMCHFSNPQRAHARTTAINPTGRRSSRRRVIKVISREAA